MKKDHKFRYQILPEYKLIIENWTGEFNLPEIIHYKNIETQDPKWNNQYNVLVDDRQSNKMIKIDLGSDTNEYLQLARGFIGKHKAAILTSSPSQVVISTFMKKNAPPQSSVEIETFSTVKGALVWLKIDLNEIDTINSVLDQLSNE